MVVGVGAVADDGFGVGQVDVTFLDRGAGGIPAALGDLAFHLAVVGGEVLPHELVAVDESKFTASFSADIR